MAAAFFFCSVFSEPVYGVSFLDQRYEQLDAPQLQKDWANSSSEPVDRLRVLLAGLFLVERNELLEKIHEAKRYQSAVTEKCRTLEEKQFTSFDSEFAAIALYVCAINEAESLSASSPLSHVSRVKRVLGWYNQALAHKPSNLLRFYAEGRIYYRLPRNLGRRVGKSLLAWQFISRMAKLATSYSYWMGKIYELQGQEKIARMHFSQGFSSQDVRTQFVFPGGSFVRSPERLDGLGFGWSPGLFYSPSAGFGAVVSVFDDRAFDTQRSVSARILGTTKEIFSVGGELVDWRLVQPIRLSLRASVSRSAQAFFGLGSRSAKSNRSDLKSSDYRVELEAEQRWWHHAYLALGWRLSGYRNLSQSGAGVNTAAVRSFSQYSLTGPFARLGWDDRDSEIAPRRGRHIEMSGLFPSKSFGSDSSFERWALFGKQYVSWSRKHTSVVLAEVQLGVGAVPFSELIHMGEAIQAPLVRRDRYQDYASAGFFLEHRWELFSLLSPIVFGGTGTVAGDLNALTRVKYLWGIGGGFLFHPIRYHRAALRLETGAFGGEFFLRVLGNVSL